MDPTRNRTIQRTFAFVTPKYFAADSYIGGGERYPLNLARGLLAADPRLAVEIIALGEPRHTSIQPRLDLRVIPVSQRSPDPFEHVSDQIAEALESVALVHIHQAFVRPSQLAVLAAKFLGKPVVMTDHGAGLPLVDRAVQYLELVDLFVFQSRFAARRFVAQCGRGAEPHTIVPGGVDDRFFRPPSARVEREHILFVGRLLAHKGIDRLVCALPPDIPLVIAGRPYDPGYERYVRALAAGRNVRFVVDGDDFEIRDLYRRAWATVMPSVHVDAWGRVYEAPELMGFSALESMACGTPTLVSATAALPEFVRHGETGFVFTSLGELGDLARQFAGGALDANALGDAARGLVEAEYSVEIVGRRLLDAYDQVIDSCGS